ncbi:MAG: hypothetical protein J6Y42_04370 [Bacilli bacterium]|nr:hypothetical protein [Bacilli bacterium]
MRFRIEKDALGEMQIPLEAYYGIGTLRSKEAFQITKHVLSRQMIKALATTKKVAAKTNGDLGIIDKKVSEAICLASDEILNGRLHGQFITDTLQDGYGYGMDINAIEVIGNRANEMLGSSKGAWDLVTKDDVTKFQTIKESIVLAGKLASVKLSKKLIAENKKTINVLKKSLENAKLDDKNSTYMQLQSVIEILDRDNKRVEKALLTVCQLSYGEAVKLNNKEREKYLDKFIENLNKETTEKYQISKNYYTTSNNLDCFMNLSAVIKNLMVNFSRCMSDLKEFAKAGRIKFPNVQDVDIEASDLLFDFVKQVSFYIVGNDLTVSRTIEAGVLNENPYIPIVMASLFESINLVRRTIRTIKEKVFEIMVIQ